MDRALGGRSAVARSACEPNPSPPLPRGVGNTKPLFTRTHPPAPPRATRSSPPAAPERQRWASAGRRWSAARQFVPADRGMPGDRELRGGLLARLACARGASPVRIRHSSSPSALASVRLRTPPEPAEEPRRWLFRWDSPRGPPRPADRSAHRSLPRALAPVLATSASGVWHAHFFFDVPQRSCSLALPFHRTSPLGPSPQGVLGVRPL